MKRTAAGVILAVLLTGCVLAGPGGVSPPPEPDGEAESSPPPWTAAGKKPHSGMFGIAWNPKDRLGPLITANRVNREMYTLIYDGLFVLDWRFEPVESLCAGMTTEDNLTFLISLRPDVDFHDGSPLTVADVVASFRIARSDASPYSSRFSHVESVKAAGEEIEVVLDRPDGRFAALLTFPIVKSGDRAFPPAGTGPYMFSSADGRNFLTPFSDWWRREPLPAGHIELNAVDRIEDITYMMSVGDISIVTSDVNDGYGVGFSGDFDIWEYPTPTMYYVGLNMDHPMLADARVRQAISCVFDREGLVSQVFKKAADPALAAVPPSVFDPGGGYDLVRYTELITLAGLEDTDNDGVLDYAAGRARVPFELRFIVDEDDSAACQTAEFLAKALNAAGIAAAAEPLTGTQLAIDIDDGNYGLYCAKVTLSADFSQERWISNAAGLPLERQTELFLEMMPIVPLLFKRERVLTHWSEVSGIMPVYGNPYVNIWEWTVKQ